jgi:predicted TIM-barrel fold metal-dependent hydrolase
MKVTNCHVHTFTHAHTPVHFVPFPLNHMLKVGWIRKGLSKIVMHFDRGRRSRVARYIKILEVSYRGTQEDVFLVVKNFYPEGTRFVLLPMDMELMGAGKCDENADTQHDKIRELTAKYPKLILPFAAADPRREDTVPKTLHRLEKEGFRGIKLYPTMGYHPNDAALRPLYEYAEKHSTPILTHCSRPASVQFRGKPTERMRKDPVTGADLHKNRLELLTLFTSPEAYVPILDAHPKLTLCLAHFGGAGDWGRFLDDQGTAGARGSDRSWLSIILELIRSEKYPNLYTDVAYTVFANDEYVHLLKVLLSDPVVARRVLFGSDFYVVESAELEERRRAVRVRAVLGEELFRQLAVDNPRTFLGEPPPAEEEMSVRDQEVVATY